MILSFLKMGWSSAFRGADRVRQPTIANGVSPVTCRASSLAVFASIWFQLERWIRFHDLNAPTAWPLAAQHIQSADGLNNAFRRMLLNS